MKLQLFEAQAMMQAFRDGKEKGLSHFMQWLYPGLLFYSFKIINDKIIAEDIVVETFEKIWDRRMSFTDAAKVKSWLYATVRNSCFDHRRLRQKEQRGFNDLGIILEGDVEKDNLELMIEAEVVSTVHRHLNNLPPRCKTTMSLLFIDGKSLTEVAREMKVSICTVKEQRARGLRLIRKQLPLDHA